MLWNRICINNEIEHASVVALPLCAGNSDPGIPAASTISCCSVCLSFQPSVPSQPSYTRDISFPFFFSHEFLSNHFFSPSLQAPPTPLLHQLQSLDLSLYDQGYPDWHRIKGSTNLTHPTLQYHSFEGTAGGLSDGTALLTDTIGGLPSLQVLTVELADLGLSFRSFADLYRFADSMYTFAKIKACMESARRSPDIRRRASTSAKLNVSYYSDDIGLVILSQS